MANGVTASLTAQNTFSDEIVVGENGLFDLSISGTFVATVTVQRRRVGDTSYLDLPATYDAPTEQTGECGGIWEYRVGIKTGDFTSGTVGIDLSI